MATESATTCPLCKEKIHEDAVRCKHCGADIEAARSALPSHEGTCPFCKESINPEAKVCWHCASNVVSSGAGPTHGGTCPFCKESIDADAVRCKHCGSDVGGSSSFRVMAMMRQEAGEGCGSECTSLDGLVKCCCAVGEKCETFAQDCRCSDAHGGGAFPGGDIFDVASGGFPGSHPFPGGMPGATTSPGSADFPPTAMRSPVGLQPDGTVVYKTKCWWLPYWICDARGCRISYYKYCITYPEVVRSPV